jgi:hypothetical protein
MPLAMVLALLYLTSITERGVTRAWKGHDWDVLNRLCKKGLISDPKSKSKSVVLSEEERGGDCPGQGGARKAASGPNDPDSGETTDCHRRDWKQKQVTAIRRYRHVSHTSQAFITS